LSFTAWRIIQRRHAKHAFDGSGARKFGGRWNSPGTAIVYTAQSQSLAILEILVHLNAPDLLQQYVLLPVFIGEALVEKLPAKALPVNWRRTPAPPALKDIGDEWVRSRRSAVLQVPSALVPTEHNFLSNPAHSDFTKLVIGEPVAFRFDSRLT
jgi:RES domain-containing protein